MPLSQSHRYFAFISYSHKDAALAKQMEKTFTRFNLPATLCEKYPQKPKKIRPIFRDLDDMKSGELTTSIEQALRDSKYLVVICSKHSAKVNDKGINWIDEEVKTYIRILANNLGLQWNAIDVEKYIFLRDLFNVREKDKFESALISFCQNNAIDYCEESLKKWSYSFRKKVKEWDASNYADLALLMEYANYGDVEFKKMELLVSEMNRRIIPVLTRPSSIAFKLGIKKRVRTSDCLPPSVKKLNYRTYDIQVQGKWRVFNNVIASMLGLELDELWNRYGKWLRLKQRIKFTFITTIILLLLGGGSFAYDYYVPKVEYYIDCINHNNIPKGIGKLTEDEIRTRYFHFRFTYHKYKLRKVETCNSYGEVIDVPSDFTFSFLPATMDISVDTDYNAAGQLISARYFNSNGALLSSERYPNMGTIEYTVKNGGMSDDSVDFRDVLSVSISNVLNFDSLVWYARRNESYVVKLGTGACSAEIKRDANGIITKICYQNAYKQSCMISEGIWGVTRNFDDLGRMKKERFIDHKGAPMGFRNGVLGGDYDYDGFYPDKIEIIHAKDNDGVSIVDYTWENGNLKSIDYKSKNGKLTYVNNVGAAVQKFDYYKKDGQLRSISYMKDENNPMYSSVRGFHKIEFFYERDGKIRRTTKYYFDEKGNRIALFNKEGNDAVWSEVEEKDTSQGLVSFLSRNQSGTLIHRSDIKYNPQGYPEWKKIYDKNNMLEMMECFTYDNGNLTQWCFKKSDGTLCPGPNGWSAISLTYDKVTGNIASAYVQDAQGKPYVTDLNPFPFVNSSYEMKEGRVKQTISYYSVSREQNGNTVDVKQAKPERKLIVTYDLQGRVECKELRNEFNDLYADPRTNAAVTKWEYKDDNTYEIKWFDAQRQPVQYKAVFCEMWENFAESLRSDSRVYEFYVQRNQTIFDEKNGRRIETITFRNEQGEIVAQPDGCIGIEKRYDALNRLVYASYIDGDNNYIEKQIREYRTDGSICGKQYTKQGLVDVVYVNSNFVRIKGPEGYCSRHIVYTDDGKLEKENYLDEDFRHVNGPEGYAIRRCEYDSTGKLTRDRYQDAHYKLVDGPEGYAEKMVRYDIFGRFKDEVYTDVSLMKFNKKGKLIEKRYRDAQGNIRGNLDGVHKLIISYDANGKSPRGKRYDAEGNLMK